MATFEAVTGPKSDRWLVKTVGALIAVIGTTLVAAAARGPASEIRYLGAATAAVLAGVDAIYVARRRISPIYLLDAVVELGILARWAGIWRWRRRARR
jgi:hypothetical protein